MSIQPLSLLRPLPVALALALAFPLVHAEVTVAADGAIAVGNDYLTTAKTGSFSQAATPVAFDAGTAPAGNKVNGIDSAANARSVSDGAGHFGASLVTDRFYGSFATLSGSNHTVLTSSLTNTSGVAQAASFSLDIASVAFSVQTGVLDGLNQASFLARVYVGGAATPIWSTGFAIDNSGSGSMVGTTTGTDIGLGAAFSAACSTGCTMFNTYRFSGAGSAVINLGTVAAGDTLQVRYEVDLATESTTYGGAASVVFNDPAGLATGAGAEMPASGALGFQPMQPVPEPATAALLAAGLAVVAGAARRRQRRDAA